MNVTKKQVVDFALVVLAGLVVMGLIGNFTQAITKNTGHHTVQYGQRVQSCNPSICVVR